MLKLNLIVAKISVYFCVWQFPLQKKQCLFKVISTLAKNDLYCWQKQFSVLSEFNFVGFQ